ncbi:MAG: NADH-quinone oxidoreductase subunit NuoH [Anaerolineales bacterium]
MNFWTDPIGVTRDWLVGLFTGWGLTPDVANVLAILLGIIVLSVFAMVLDVFLVWIERKVVARFQDRLGPNRIGPFGIFQPFADVIKLIIKEDITPATADKFVFNLAPILSLASVLILWAVLPLASTVYGVDLNVAVLYLVAAGALGTLSIIMAGWASDNKYALVGAYRMVAAMISFEIPMVVALLIPTILAGTLSMKGISEAQNQVWFFFVSPLGAILFLIAAIAELGRSPFDLNEGESEIVAGFHIEYTGMKFGLFYAGELLHAFTFGAFLGVLFFGGWNGPLPFGDKYALIGIFNVIFKGMFFYWVIMWVKYTVPRIRIDHMLAFNWKFLTPVAFALLMVTAVLHRLLLGAETWVYVAFMLAMNLVFGWTVVEILRASARRERESVEGKSRPAAAQN